MDFRWHNKRKMMAKAGGIVVAAAMAMAVSIGFGCTARRPAGQREVFKPIDINPKLAAGDYLQRVNYWVTLLDVSQSMCAPYRYVGETKISYAKELIHHIEQTMPRLKINSAIRTFGYGPLAADGSAGSYQKALPYMLGPYDGTAFDKRLEEIDCDGGSSSFGDALKQIIEEVAASAEEIAILLVSDGSQMDDSAVAAAQALKDQYSNRLCIFTILVGGDPYGRNLLRRISNTSNCGAPTVDYQVDSPQELADFIENVFLTRSTDVDGDGVLDNADECLATPRGALVDSRGCSLDSDGDGVFDHEDICPATPRGSRVDRRGCVLDTDQDGVPDLLDLCPDTSQGAFVDNHGCSTDSDADGVPDNGDRCPDTPDGILVDSQGCPVDTDKDGVYDDKDQCPGTPGGASVNEKGCWVLSNVLFESGSSEFLPESLAALDEAVAVLLKSPNIKVEIGGHTDNVGSEDKNRSLSESRALAVLVYMTKKGIERNRLSSAGYGSSRPVASNDSAYGRGKNRRVELTPRKD